VPLRAGGPGSPSRRNGTSTRAQVARAPARRSRARTRAQVAHAFETFESHRRAGRSCYDRGARRWRTRPVAGAVRNRRRGVRMSGTAPLHVVTGALGYTGRALTERLLARGVRVRTLTHWPNRPNPFGAQLQIAPLAFDEPAALREALRGADVLYNTYWV